jgi:cell division protein FtsW
LLIIGLALLVSVWLPGIGIAKNGAHRWIGHEPFSVQPSEFAKLAVIIYLAALLSRNNYNIRSVGDGLIVPVCVIAVFAFLVEREPDLGTAAILFLAAMTVLYLAGARIKHLAALVAAAALLFILVSVFGHGFRNGRLTSFLNPEKDYYGRGFQVTRGLVAVGSGGVLGVGIGAGREKFYLPEANSDFIFATIAEEGGLWGSLIIIGLLFLVGRQGFLIARRTNDPFGSLLAAGIAAMISWQAIINVAVVTHLIPATGVPLPFISFGGSSLLFLLTGIGILLNISQHPDVKVREEA